MNRLILAEFFYCFELLKSVNPVDLIQEFVVFRAIGSQSFEVEFLEMFRLGKFVFE